MTRRVSTLLLLLATSPFATAENYLDIVERAFATLDNDYRERWAFTETTTSDDGERVARYDPGVDANGRWTLVSVDGRDPTESELREFRKEKQPRDDDKRERRGMDRLHADTLELIEETNDYWLFAFVPADEDEDDDFMREMDGRLQVVKQGHYVANMRLENRGTIRPAFGVKITRFMTELHFAPLADGGPVVPRSVDVEVRGRAYLAVGFDEKESIRYDAYERVATAP